MNALKFFKINFATAGAIFALSLAVLALSPRKIATTRAENCQGAPTVATLNPFPVSWSDITGNDCTDAPAIAIRNINGGNYAPSASAQDAEEFYVLIYVHNGAQEGLDYNQTTAFQVEGGINVSGNQISADFDGVRSDGSLTNTIYGSVSVNLPPDSRLEIIQGSGEFFDHKANPISGSANLRATDGFFSMGDMQACFQYSKFFRFKVKVIGPARQTPNPTGQISGQVDSRVFGQCLYNGAVRWQTQNAGEVEVTVRDPANGSEKIFASHANESGTQVNWLEPGKNYRFTVWRLLNGVRESFYGPGNNLETWLVVPDLNCGAPTPTPTPTPTPPPADETKDFALSADNNLCVGGRTRFTVNAATRNLYQQPIFWSSTKNGQSTGEINSYYGHTLNSSGNWSDSGFVWQFGDIGHWTKTATIGGVSKTVSFTVKDCSAPPALPPLVCQANPAGAAKIGETVLFTAFGGSGAVTWSNATGNPGNPVPVANASAYSTRYTTPGIKTVTVSNPGGQSAQCQIQILPAQPTPTPIPTPTPTPPPPAQCPSGNARVILNPSIINIGEFSIALAPAGFTGGGFISSQPQIAEMADGPRSAALKGLRAGTAQIAGIGWTAPNGAVNCPLAASTITVRVPSITPPVEVSATATATASATAFADCPNGTQARATATASATANATAATLAEAQRLAFDRAYVQAQAAAYVQAQARVVCASPPPPPPPLACSPLLQSALIDQPAVFYATGGNGSYVWSAPSGAPASGVGSSFVTRFSAVGSKAVIVASGSQSRVCNVAVSQTSSNAPAGDCNNSDGSCNRNNNSNSQTNSNATNSSNQNNSTNINGNNNTVTASNQNCVNNSCNNTNNIVYINQAGSTVSGNDFRQLAISKLVRLANGGGFQNSVSANNNDLVEFEILVRNAGNQVINKVQLSDTWNGSLSLQSGSVKIDGNYAGDNLNAFSLGDLFSGQQKRITFQARAFGGSSQSIQNTARAWGDNAGPVQDDAWVFVNVINPGCTFNCGGVQGSSVNLIYGKRAVNETKNADAAAVIAAREDFITYTLTVRNTGAAPASGFVITDDLSQVLPYADLVDSGGGALNGNIISYPGLTVPAGGSVSKSFKVRVKFALAANLSYSMVNTYGDTITVRINAPQVMGAFVAPRTGGPPSLGSAAVFASLAAAGFAAIRLRKKVWEMIWD